MGARLAVAIIPLLIAACGPSSFVDKIATPDQKARAERYIELLVEGQHDSLLAHTPPAALENAKAGLTQMDVVLNKQRLDSLQLIAANKRVMSNGTMALNLTYEAHRAAGWLVVSFATVDSAEKWHIDGIRVDAISDELERLNRFELAGRSIKQYLFLVLVALCVLFTVGSALYLATRRDFPSRWRWVLCSLIGVCTLQMNWTTGEIMFRLLNGQLFAAAGVRASLFAPWIFAASFPLGAVIALYRYRKIRIRKS